MSATAVQNTSALAERCVGRTLLLMTAMLLAISTAAGAAPLKPASHWLSVWGALQNQSTTTDYGQVTRVRLFNPADPADPAAATAHVTVTWYLYDCWGVAAAEETLPVPPGQYNGVSSLFAAYPETLVGNGCLAIRSDAPIVPVNGRIEEGSYSYSTGQNWRSARRTEFWRTGQPGHTAWSSYWEHSTPLGGPQYGGHFTGAYILYPARQKGRTAPPVPPAQVTVTHFVGACNSSTIWRQDTFQLGSGEIEVTDSSPAAGATGSGQGCLLVTSDQPVVAFNGAIYDISHDPASGDTSRSEVAITFQPVYWNATAP